MKKREEAGLLRIVHGMEWNGSRSRKLLDGEAHREDFMIALRRSLYIRDTQTKFMPTIRSFPCLAGLVSFDSVAMLKY